MFTGLIETTGTLLAITPTEGATRITIASPTLTARLNTGDSIAVNGVCLTALSIEPNAFPPRFSADLAAETIARTTLSHLCPDAIVNLELPTPAGSPLGGHVVQGHVDGVGTVRDVRDDGFARLVEIAAARDLLRYVVEKGSIAVDGISLTVVEAGEDFLSVSLIPETLERTNLGAAAPGQPVNLEVDVLAKYVEKLILPRDEHASSPSTTRRSSPLRSR
jgi:riboflavin synthase